MEYLRAFSSELFKCRRTWAFTLATVAPAGIVALIFMATLKVPDRAWNDVWIFYLRGVIWMWLLMMTPFYVALLLAILASTDHRAGTWKVLLVQSVSRPPLYLAKLAVGLLLVAWSQVVLLAICLGVGFVLPKVRPHLGSYTFGVSVKHLAVMLAVAYAATLLIVAIQTWLTMRSANFVLSLGVVIFAEVVNVFALQQVSVQKYSPWLFPFDAVRLFGLQPRDSLQHFWPVSHLLLVATLVAVVVTLLGMWDFSRREL